MSQSPLINKKKIREIENLKLNFYLYIYLEHFAMEPLKKLIAVISMVVEKSTPNQVI